MSSRTIEQPANARSRRTRAKLLASARAILEATGFEALTIAGVADHAGVTRRTVYLHFGTRSELIAALFDAVAEAEGLTASLEAVWAAPDAPAALDAWAAHLAHYHVRLLAVDRAVHRVWRDDPDAERHRRRAMTEKMTSCRRLATRLATEGILADPWTRESAADMLFALDSSETIEALVGDRRWSRRRLSELLAVLLRRTFLT